MNEATVTGDFMQTTVNDKDKAHYFGAAPAIDVEKYVSIDGGTSWVDADTATGPYLTTGIDPQFKFVIENIGNVALTDVDVVDSVFGNIHLDGALAVDAIETYYHTADWAAGQHMNEATVTGDFMQTTVNDKDKAHYFGAAPAIDVEKYVSIDGGTTWEDADAATGPYMTSSSDPQFKFVIENIGNVDLTDVDLVDSVFGNIHLDGTLAVDQIATYYHTADWAAGQHMNEATVTGDFVDANEKTATASDKDKAHYYGSDAKIDVEKYVSVDGGVTWDDADTATGPYLESDTDPQFKFVIENTGNVELTDVDLVDSVFGNIHLDGTLAVDQIATYYHTADWAAGQHMNEATVTGDFMQTTVNDKDKAHYFGAAPAIDVEKYVSIDGGTSWVDADTATGPYLTTGIDPQFKFVIENIGNVALTDVDLVDSVFGNIHLDGALAVDAIETYYHTADWAAGQHMNEATVTGDFMQTTVNDKDKAHYFGAAPAIDVEKYVSVDGGTTWEDADAATGPFALSGSDPQFKFVVENTGNVDLTNVDLVDSDFLTISADGDLAAGAISTYYYLDADWAAGQHANTATVTGDYYDTNETKVPVFDADMAHYFGATPSIDIEKFVSVDGGATWDDADAVTGPYLSNGTAPQFKFVVENTGNVELTELELTDTDFQSLVEALPVGVVPSSLGAGATFEAVIIAPWAAGQHANTGTIAGEFTVDEEVSVPVTDSDDAHYFGAAPAITIVKTAAPGVILSGETVTYTYLVTNTGNVTLAPVTVTDDKLGPIGTIDMLAPGESDTLTTTSAIAVDTVNVGTATGTPPVGEPVKATDDAKVDVINPAIDVEKTANPAEILPGEDVTYTYVVTNTGDVDLVNVTVEDDKLGTIAEIPLLAVGESQTFTKTVPISVSTTNTVVATGTDEYGHKVTDQDKAFVDVGIPFTPPDLTIDKSADKTEAEPGDTVKYTLTYENIAEGSQATDITIVDDFDERYVTVVDAAGGVVEDGTITWKIDGPLYPEDGPQTITYSVKISDDLPDSVKVVRNTVVISAPDEENTDNNSDSWEVEIPEPFLPFTGSEMSIIALLVAMALALGMSFRRLARTIA